MISDKRAAVMSDLDAAEKEYRDCLTKYELADSAKNRAREACEASERKKNAIWQKFIALIEKGE